MTQEIRINVDANIYSRPGEDEVVNHDIFVVYFRRIIKQELESNFPSSSHKFLNVKVTLVPHDNDRDYTEEDAERHLNGEPEKKRKTYAEDFFEKFPKAERVAVLTAHDGVKQIPAVKFIAVYPPKATPKTDPRQDAMIRNIQMWLAEMDDGE